MSSLVAPQTAALCNTCGTPLDSRPFDAYGIMPLQQIRTGETVVLASFTLPAQYCGVLQCFSQYTDRLVKEHHHGSPNLRWTLRMNGRPLAPYHDIDFIINPWGYGSFPVELRMDEAATVELVLRKTGKATQINEVGGRITGRYWYNELYGARSNAAALSQRTIRR